MVVNIYQLFYHSMRCYSVSVTGFVSVYVIRQVLGVSAVSRPVMPHRHHRCLTFRLLLQTKLSGYSQ